MDELEFKAYYDALLDQVIKLLNADRQVIETELSHFM